MLNNEGKSFSFDSRGQGYGRGEEIATIVVKRLDDATKVYDPIRAVIRNTRVNQDGRTDRIRRPTQSSQEMLARSLYHDIDEDPASVEYVEAHGTGTQEGDAIEIQAIGEVFGQGRDRSLLVGSIKGNMGHLEACSRLSSLTKAILIIENGVVPPVANFDSPKASLQLDKWNIRVWQ